MLTNRYSYIQLLDSLPRNTTIRNGLESRSLKNESSLPLTREAFKLNRLNSIHVSGSKGKGSTCTYIERILHSHGFKTGLFTSPHLISPKERILINGLPLDDIVFDKYICDSYNLLYDPHNPIPFFRFITVTAFHIFLKENVDVAIIEVGIGGRYDCTNILPAPVACGVTSLSLEHTNLLGEALSEIAWHKCGIFKPSSFAFIMDQSPNAELNGPCLNFARKCDAGGMIVYDTPSLLPGISGTFQTKNCSLAISIASYWLSRYNCPHSALEDLVVGIKLKGRQDMLQVAGTSIYLDVAHTVESIADTVHWLKKEVGSNPKHKLSLFFCCSNPRRPDLLITPFLTLNLHVIYYYYGPNSVTGIEELEFICRKININLVVIAENELESNFIKECAASDSIAICGSFYLVGKIYEMLELRF